MIFALFLFFIIKSYALDVQIDTPYAVLINNKTGRILYNKRGDQKTYPASTTKIATVAFVLGNLSEDELNDVIYVQKECLESAGEFHKEEMGYTLPPYLLEPDGSTIYLMCGERIYRRDLIYGAMLTSGNDAANVLAHSLYGSIDEFMDKVNEYLHSIGCVNTQFNNPHGLFHPEHYTTAIDLAIMTKFALMDHEFSSICSCLKYERARENGIRSRVYEQHNALLLNGPYFYRFAKGCKTGYTRKSGYCLVANASNGTRDLIAVLLKSPDSKTRFRDAIRLFEAAFNEKMKSRILVNRDDQTFIYSDEHLRRDLIAELENDVLVEYYPSEKGDYSLNIEWAVNEYPILKGEIVGDLIICSDDKPIKYTLYASSTVRLKLKYLIKHHFSASWHFYFLGMILFPIIFFRWRKK